MFYIGKCVVSALIACCMAILPEQVYNITPTVTLLEDVLPVTAYAVHDKTDINTEEALGIEDKVENTEVPGNTEPKHKKIFVEADRAIEDAVEITGQHNEVQPQNTEEIRKETLKENIIIAERGNYGKVKYLAAVPQFNLSDEEFNLVAQVVQAEAGGEPYEGQVAVANVIFNRLKAGWGRTVTEVITQKGQFTKVRKKPSASVKEAVKEALYGKNAVPEGTLFFQNLDISKDFTIPRSKKYVTKIGRHTFYR